MSTKQCKIIFNNSNEFKWLYIYHLKIAIKMQFAHTMYFKNKIKKWKEKKMTIDSNGL